MEESFMTEPKEIYTYKNNYHEVELDSVHYVTSMCLDRWVFIGKFIVDDFGNLVRFK